MTHADMIKRLEGLYTPEEAEAWMRRPQPLLNNAVPPT